VEVLERLAKIAAMRFIVSGDDEWPDGIFYSWPTPVSSLWSSDGHKPDLDRDRQLLQEEHPKVDRAIRTEDFARLIRLSEEQGWRLIITEMGIDTRTPTGKAMAHLAVIFAELERDFIRMRTGEAMQVKKENGVTLGKPRSTLEDVVARIWAGAHGG
jgi:hypothetical protein